VEHYYKFSLKNKIVEDPSFIVIGTYRDSTVPYIGRVGTVYHTQSDGRYRYRFSKNENRPRVVMGPGGDVNTHKISVAYVVYPSIPVLPYHFYARLKLEITHESAGGHHVLSGDIEINHSSISSHDGVKEIVGRETGRIKL